MGLNQQPTIFGYLFITVTKLARNPRAKGSVSAHGFRGLCTQKTTTVGTQGRRASLWTGNDTHKDQSLGTQFCKCPKGKDGSTGF